jgi:hypothetical protein
MHRWMILALVVALVTVGAVWAAVALHVPPLIGVGLVLVTAGALWPPKRPRSTHHL